jgi:hypothetical protein
VGGRKGGTESDVAFFGGKEVGDHGRGNDNIACLSHAHKGAEADQGDEIVGESGKG